MSMNRRFVGTALIGSALVAALPAWAQTAAFPNKPMRIIVPYPAGGATDVSARLVAQRLQEDLKQNVIVDNRPGASGNLGMVGLLQSPADGHTLAMSLTGMLSINPTTYSKAGFTAADVVPVARVMLAPLVLVYFCKNLSYIVIHGAATALPTVQLAAHQVRPSSCDRVTS